jgi:hypothetical protein
MEGPKKMMETHNQDNIPCEILGSHGAEYQGFVHSSRHDTSSLGTQYLHFQANNIDSITSHKNIIFSLFLSSFSTQQPTEHGALHHI